MLLAWLSFPKYDGILADETKGNKSEVVKSSLFFVISRFALRSLFLMGTSFSCMFPVEALNMYYSLTS